MDEKHKLKQKIVSAATAASLLVSGTFSPPANLPEDLRTLDSPPAIIEMVMPDVSPDDDDDSLALPEEEKKRKNSRQKIVLSAGLLLLMWAGGIILAALAVSSLTAILGTAACWIITAALLFVSYIIISKLIFPDLPLKKILNWKSILVIIFVSSAISFVLKGLIFK